MRTPILTGNAKQRPTVGSAKMPGGNRLGKALQNVNTEGVRLFLRTCFVRVHGGGTRVANV